MSERGSTKLIALETPRGVAKADAIALLEEFLAQAKAGEIVCVAIAAVRPDMRAETGYSETDCFTALLGAVSSLDKRMAQVVEFE